LRRHDGFVLVHTDRQDVAVVTDNLGSATIDGAVLSAGCTVRSGDRARVRWARKYCCE